jgi:hypothetical protein
MAATARAQGPAALITWLQAMRVPSAVTTWVMCRPSMAKPLTSRFT